MASTDAKAIPVKGAALRITFPIFDADGDLVTGATGLDSEVSIDGGTFADCTNEATEIATASGMYYLDLTSGEMNGDTIAVIVKTSSSGAKTTPIVMYTAARSINDLATATALDAVDNFVDTEIGALQTDVTAIKAKTDNLPSDPADASVVAGLIAAVESKIDTVDTNVDAILVDTAEIGAAGAGLTAVPWNPAWDAEVQSEAADALAAYDPPTKAELDTAVAPLATAANLATVGGYIDTEIASLQSDLAAVKAKTDGLPSDPADASVVAGLIAAVEAKVDTIDSVVDAVKVTTDKVDDTLEDDGGTFRFTANALEEAPTGSGSGLDAAGVRAAIGLASANLDTQLGDLPTNAELATSQAAADDATLAAIAALDAKVGTPAASVSADIAAVKADTASLITKVDTVDDLLDTEVAAIKSVVDAIKAKTDALPSDPADASVLAGLIAALEAKVDTIDAIADAILVDTAEIGSAGAGLTALATAANLAIVAGYLDTEIAAIKAKTDNLPSDPADASDVAAAIAAVSSKVDAVKAKTDSLAFTVTGQVDANVQSINDVAVTGDGQTGTEFGVA